VEFEWDENKNRINLEKHGILFEDAVAVFADPEELTEPSPYALEQRLQTIGRAEVAILFVVHTLRSEPGEEPRIRIISARPASRSERMRYERRS
jgi:uncharacterized DUF497 family protein